MLEKIRRHFASPINKKAASITALALIALAIPLTVFISQQQQELRQRAGGGPFVSLVLSPSNQTVAPGSSFDAQLSLDAGGNQVTGIDTVIKYNKDVLEVTNFQPSTTFNSQLVNKIDNQAGTLRYAAVHTQGASTGIVEMGTITFRAKAQGTSTVDFENVQVTALEQAGALPVGNNSTGTYAVAESIPSPEPSVTPLPVTPGPASGPQIFHFGTAFSNVQGKSNLYYLAYRKSSNSYVDAVWDGNKWTYTGGDSDRNFQISKGSIAPSYGANSVVRWVAHQGGELTISGLFQRCCTEPGDFNYSPRTIYSVRKNNEVLWKQDANDKTTYKYSLSTQVTQGEKIEFWADANNDSGWDGTTLDFAISFLPSQSPTLPPGATPSPVQGNSIKWKTNTVSLEADNFYIVADGKQYLANTGNVDIHSDPGSPNYTTLESTWQENDVEMRLFMYFAAENGKWKVSEVRTYNGKQPGNWIFYDGFAGEQLGTTLVKTTFDLTGKPSDDPNYNTPGSIHFENLRLEAFINQAILGDANGDRVVDILDFNIWRDEFLGIVTTKKSDFNKDGVVDLVDFSIWRNAISNPSSPQPTPTSPPQASAKRVFVTSTTYNGNLGGLVGADAKCQAGADSANLGGTWKAWLSDSNTSANSRLTHNSGPYKRLDGVTVADNWADLIDGNLQNSIGTTETGSIIGGWYVWTFTSLDGETLINKNSYNCHNWTTAGSALDNDLGIVGNNGYTNEGWTTSLLNPPCTGNYQVSSPNIHLYCFEQ